MISACSTALARLRGKWRRLIGRFCKARGLFDENLRPSGKSD
jgi:hypothetical protein